MNIKIKRNIRANRIILIDKKTGIAFQSFNKTEKIFKFVMEYYKDEIEYFNPVKL